MVAWLRVQRDSLTSFPSLSLSWYLAYLGPLGKSPSSWLLLYPGCSVSLHSMLLASTSLLGTPPWIPCAGTWRDVPTLDYLRHSRGLSSALSSPCPHWVISVRLLTQGNSMVPLVARPPIPTHLLFLSQFHLPRVSLRDRFLASPLSPINESLLQFKVKNDVERCCHRQNNWLDHCCHALLVIREWSALPCAPRYTGIVSFAVRSSFYGNCRLCHALLVIREWSALLYNDHT